MSFPKVFRIHYLTKKKKDFGVCLIRRAEILFKNDPNKIWKPVFMLETLQIILWGCQTDKTWLKSYLKEMGKLQGY